MFCGAFENEWDYPKIHEHCLIIDYKLKTLFSYFIIDGI
jgi:hypothetical protein